MEPSDIKAFVEQELRNAIGEGRISDVSVDVKPDDEGGEYLDIRVHFAPGRGLPSAAESIGSLLSLQHLLRARGEMRFPNVLYMSSDAAA